MSLPSCQAQTPACGACGLNTTFDGDSFLCYGCGINYLDGDEANVPEFIEEVSACGEPCENYWHGPGQLNLTCSPCELPKDHSSLHWTDCQ